jgi:hypothetical protein
MIGAGNGSENTRESIVILLFLEENEEEEEQVRAKHDEIEALLQPPPTSQRREDVQGSSQLTQTAGNIDDSQDAIFQTLPEQENSASGSQDDDVFVRRATNAAAVLWL